MIVVEILPSNILVTSFESIRPVGICMQLFGVEMAKDIHKPFLKEKRKILSFLRSEASCFMVALGVLQI